jgi:hypothetical protein
MESISRNAPCPCGSGKKYKHCHLGQEPDNIPAKRSSLAGPAVAAVASTGLGAYFGLQVSVGLGLSVGLGALIVIGLFLMLRDPPPPGKGGDPGAINFGK